MSHWENFDADGRPRQLARPQNAAAIAELLAQALGRPVDPNAFLSSKETSIDRALRELANLRATQTQVVRDQRRLSQDLTRALAMIRELHGR